MFVCLVTSSSLSGSLFHLSPPNAECTLFVASNKYPKFSFSNFPPTHLTRYHSEGGTCKVPNRSTAERFNEKNRWELWENHIGLALNIWKPNNSGFVSLSLIPPPLFYSRFLIPNLPTTPHEVTVDIRAGMVTSIASWACRLSQIKGALTDPLITLTLKEKFTQKW